MLDASVFLPEDPPLLFSSPSSPSPLSSPLPSLLHHSPSSPPHGYVDLVPHSLAVLGYLHSFCVSYFHEEPLQDATLEASAILSPGLSFCKGLLLSLSVGPNRSQNQPRSKGRGKRLLYTGVTTSYWDTPSVVRNVLKSWESQSTRSALRDTIYVMLAGLQLITEWPRGVYREWASLRNTLGSPDLDSRNTQSSQASVHDHNKRS